MNSAKTAKAIGFEFPVVDSHHHLWGDGFDLAKPFGRYLPEDFLAEIVRSGHRLAGSIYVDCGWAYRTHGPEELRSVGETEYVEAVAEHFAAAADGPAGRVAAGIVGRAD